MTTSRTDYHNPMTTARPDEALVPAFLETVTVPGVPFEIRVLNTRFGGPAGLRHRTYSGFFDHIEPAVNAVCRITGRDAAGVYVTINPLLAHVLNWNHNILDRAVTSAGDCDVTRLRHLYLDADPVRPRYTCATSDEQQAAKIHANNAANFLMRKFDFPPPVWAGSSGSGALALWRVDLPVERTSLIERVLAALSARFSDDSVKIDTTVHNPSRIVRVAGTINAKSPTPQLDRPWRTATGKAFATDVVTEDQLEAVAALAPVLPRRDARASAYDGPAYDLARLLDKAGIEFTTKERDYATVYELASCLTSTEHDGGASLIQFPSGAVAYRCLHDSCSTKGWRDVKLVLDVPENRSFPTNSHRENVGKERSGRGDGAFRPIRVVNGKVAS